MSGPRHSAPAARDRSLRRVRAAQWGTGVVAAGLTATLSLAAANAFKGHSDKTPVTHATAVPQRPAPSPVQVPPPERVPAIAGQPAPPEPPAEAPQSVPPAPQPVPEPLPAPVTSGGS